MSNNYDLRTNICGHCDRYDLFHIGKVSGGWSFLFHGERQRQTGLTPQEMVIKSFEDWKPFLKQGKIFDEYGEGCPYDEFVAMIEELRKTNHRVHALEYPEHSWVDPEGHSFTDGVFS